MAYEIHDGLAQQLTGALLKLQSLETIQDYQDFPAARKILDDVLLLIRESVAEARRLIGDCGRPFSTNRASSPPSSICAPSGPKAANRKLSSCPGSSFLAWPLPWKSRCFASFRNVLPMPAGTAKAPKSAWN